MPLTATLITQVYSVALLVNALLALGLVVFVSRYTYRPASRWLVWIMLASAWWSLTIFGEYLVTSLSSKIFWSKMQYFGAVSVPVFVLFFSLEYCNQPRWLTRRLLPLYWIVPITAVVLAWTNEWHGLIWASFSPREMGNTVLVVYGPGPGYWAMILYAYLCLIISIGLLARSAWHQQQIYRRQAIFLILIILLPWLGEIAYNARVLPGLDFTVFGLTIAGILLVWNLRYFNLLSLMPIARDQVFVEMQHAVLVLDDQQRVVNLNPAAQKLFNLSSTAIGQPAPASLMANLKSPTRKPVHVEADWPGPPPRLLSITNSALVDSKGHVIGQLLVCRDITAEKQSQQELWLRQLDVALLEERHTVSRELHSETRQVLRDIAVLAHNATHLVEDEQLASAATTLAQLIEITGSAGVDIDQFVQQSLEDAGSELFAAHFFESLASYVRRFSDIHNLSVAFTCPDPSTGELLTVMAQIQLLRIVQQALLSASQSERTTDMQIIVSHSEGMITTIITQVGALPVPPFLQARAIAVGGSMELRATPGQGNHWVVQLPCRPSVNRPIFTDMRVLLVDDHEILLAGFKDLLERRGLQVVGTASTGEQAVELAHQLQPDIVLMDVRMPGISGIEALRQIKAQQPEVEVIMLTMSQDRDDLLAALRHGASGYLLKTLDTDKFFDMFISAMNGDMPVAPELAQELLIDLAHAEDEVEAATTFLTSQQLDVLRLIAQGHTYRQVGVVLHLSEHTVRYHVEQIRNKLNVASRAEAVARAIQLGLIDAPS